MSGIKRVAASGVNEQTFYLRLRLTEAADLRAAAFERDAALDDLKTEINKWISQVLGGAWRAVENDLVITEAEIFAEAARLKHHPDDEAKS